MKIADRLKKSFGRKHESIRFAGDFKSWDEAERLSTGYAAPEILQKTRAALLKVKAGEAAFERDSVLFSTTEHNFPLLAGLLRIATADHGRLSILDFGGALGGSYFQHRSFLSAVTDLEWNVVDQPAQVKCGKADFANEQLHFYETIAECLSERQPNVLLLSGVLQCLPDPYLFLEKVLKEEIPYVIVERTGFDCRGRDRITIQYVPAWIYQASYPVWFLNESSFRKIFAERYELICEYNAENEPSPREAKGVFKGFQFQSKNAPLLAGVAARHSLREDH
jgi:putative methyltransferase (TIGR04325 family)